MLSFVVIILVSVHHCACQQNSALSAKISPAIVRGTASGVCPSAEVLDAQRNATKQEIKDLLQNTVIPALSDRNRNGPSCSCGGPGEWTRIAFLNMADLTQQCPTNWRLITSPVRACGRSSTSSIGCDSTIFPSNDRSYSHVCGRIIGYQKGSSDAYYVSTLGNTGIENSYIDGLSLTHGAAGSRQHIWSFVSANHETALNYQPRWNCPCTNSNVNWPYQVPSFIGNNYFCDTGNPGPGYSSNALYSDNPIWDGQGCGPTSTCCEFNNPPWFCTTLTQPTSDDIELRICFDANDEDTLVSLIDLHMM